MRLESGLKRGWVCSVGVLSLTALLLIAGGLPRAGAAEQLGKPAARAAAKLEIGEFVKSHSWADTGAVGRCSRRSEARIDCSGNVRGKRRSCAFNVEVSAAASGPVARLRLGKCHSKKAPPARTIRLSAHIAPGPARNLLNPFSVIYSYGAAATSEVPGRPGSVKPARLPSGVLSLYSDGQLECSADVSAASPVWTCPVDYVALGIHRLTATYAVGSETASAILVDDVEPLATGFTLSVSYEPNAVAPTFAYGCSELPCELEAGAQEEVEFEIGALTITASKVTPWGVPPKSNCPADEADPACIPFSLGPDNTARLEVWAKADLVIPANQMLEHEGEPIDGEMGELESATIGGGTLGYLPLAEIEAGVYHLRATSGDRPGFVKTELTRPLPLIPARADALQLRY